MKRQGLFSFDSIITTVFLLLFILIYIHYYPQYLTFGDEGEYFHTAYLLSKGMSPKVTDPAYSYRFSLHENKFFLPTYAIGTPVLMLPLALVFWKLVFVSGLLFHIVGFFFFYKIVKKMKYESYYSLLYLFFPGIVFFSRTIMSEVPSAVLILIAFYFYIDSRKYSYLVSGALFGFACVVRYPNLLAFVPFIFTAFLEFINYYALKIKRLPKNRLKFVFLLAGFIPFAIFILLYNNHMYGGPLTTWNSLMGSVTGSYTKEGDVYNIPTLLGVFNEFLKKGSVDNREMVLNHIFMESFQKYAIIFMTIYPLMLLSPLFYRGPAKAELIWATYGFVFAIGLVLHRAPFHYTFLRNLIIGGRYIFPVIPLFIIAYVPFMDKILSLIRQKKRSVIVLIFVILLCLTWFMSKVHYEYTLEASQIMHDIYAHTEKGSLIVGNPYVLMFVNGLIEDRKTFKVYDLVEDKDNKVRMELMKDFIKDYNVYVVFITDRTVKEELSSNVYKVTGVTDDPEQILEGLKYNLVFKRENPYSLRIYKLKE